MTYRLTPDAQADLEEIRRFTRQEWGEAQSFNYLQEIQKTLQTLSKMPGMGKKCDDIQQGLFRFPCRRHMLYFRIEGSFLFVIGVVHHSRIPQDHLNLE